MRTWRFARYSLWRKRRARRFRKAHAANRLVWLSPGGVWPGLALDGPWAGIAEDLTNEAFTVQSLADEPKQTLTSGTGDISGSAGVRSTRRGMRRPAWARDAGAQDLT